MLKMSSVDGCILWGLRSKNTKPESDLMPLNDKRWLLHIRSASSASIRKVTAKSLFTPVVKTVDQKFLHQHIIQKSQQYKQVKESLWNKSMVIWSDSWRDMCCKDQQVACVLFCEHFCDNQTSFCEHFVIWVSVNHHFWYLVVHSYYHQYWTSLFLSTVALMTLRCSVTRNCTRTKNLCTIKSRVKTLFTISKSLSSVVVNTSRMQDHFRFSFWSPVLHAPTFTLFPCLEFVLPYICYDHLDTDHSTSKTSLSSKPVVSSTLHR